jgi:hypothetical protein
MLSAPTFPLAEKLTTLRPNAMHPLNKRTSACERGTPPILRSWRQPETLLVPLRKELYPEWDPEATILRWDENVPGLCCVPKRERRSSSPDHCAYNTHCTKARGDILVSRSNGWSSSRGGTMKRRIYSDNERLDTDDRYEFDDVAGRQVAGAGIFGVGSGA